MEKFCEDSLGPEKKSFSVHMRCGALVGDLRRARVHSLSGSFCEIGDKRREESKKFCSEPRVLLFKVVLINA